MHVFVLTGIYLITQGHVRGIVLPRAACTGFSLFFNYSFFFFSDYFGCCGLLGFVYDSCMPRKQVARNAGNVRSEAYACVLKLDYTRKRGRIRFLIYIRGALLRGSWIWRREKYLFFKNNLEINLIYYLFGLKDDILYQNLIINFYLNGFFKKNKNY